MTAREVLLKHMNKGVSDNRKKFNDLVNWDIQINIMEEYAEQEAKKAFIAGALSRNESYETETIKESWLKYKKENFENK